MTSFKIITHQGFDDFFQQHQNGTGIGPIDITRPAQTVTIDQALIQDKIQSWPVVYILNDRKHVYVGETLSASKRLRDHSKNREKSRFDTLRIVLEEKFNKSAALDFESYLIRLFAGEGRYKVTNRNNGIINADYYGRAEYRKLFDDIFGELRSHGLFSMTRQEIENRDLYKFSPFKEPNDDQETVGARILENFLADLRAGRRGEEVVQGGAGTGKTILAIYMLKLLRDIERYDPNEPSDSEEKFSQFFNRENQSLLKGFTAGIVIPQQSLRASVRRVFRHTPDLEDTRILTPFEVGTSDEVFDLLIVDETHRLNRRANQSSGPLNAKYRQINEKLFGEDRDDITQLDWVREKSKHRILMIDVAQTVRPADISAETMQELANTAEARGRLHRLLTQMRVKGGAAYTTFIRDLLDGDVDYERPDFGEEYEFGMFTNLKNMRDKILSLDKEHGLSRLVAGFAWEWKSKNDEALFDIEEDGLQLQWNSTDKDWINSEKSVDEVGSIHTVQGYDLNYAGVIIGRDLRLDPDTGRIYFDRENYFDKKGVENNRRLGINFTDEDILEYVKNVYAVLLGRGMLGTFIYVCDEPLREYFSEHLPLLEPS